MRSTRDSTLPDERRSKADLQRDVAELRRMLDERTHERNEALQRETATAEVLGVINSSPGDLAPVFDAMLDRATSLCEAAFGVLWIIDGERIWAVATHNVPSSYRDFLETEAASSPGPSSGVAQTIRAKSPLLFADAMAGDAYQSGDPFAVAAVELGGVRTLLNAPLVKDDAVLGILAVYRKEVRPFSEKQIALLQAFAAQAVIAMENARLITETREALEQQTATAEVLGVINSSLGDLAPVFDAMLARATRLCGASCGNLFAYDGEVLQTVAAHGDTRLVELLRQVGAFRPGSHIERLLKDEPFLSINDATKEDSYRRYVAVPLRKDDRLLGFIAVYREEERPYTERQIALLQDFAAQAVIAMDNARLLGELRERNEEIAGWNRELETRVANQLAELERTGKLRRFLAPQLADLIIAQGDESILDSHRREIVVVFCDMRGFTAFSERAEPEEVMALLRDYHAALGPIVARFEGTLDHYSGDGVMVFFNDPLPTPEPAKRAIEMALAMREAAQQVLKTWRRHGYDLGFGVGISQGYATLGQIGFAERMDYTAIGTVTNLAARLCSEAKDGQILISRRVAVAVEDDAKLEEIGEVSLKGLSQAVAVYNVVQ
jgi:adenylate cyclase